MFRLVTIEREYGCGAGGIAAELAYTRRELASLGLSPPAEARAA